MGRGLRLEDVSRGKKMYFEQLEDVSRGKKMYLEQTCVVCKAFGWSWVKAKRFISRQEEVYFEQTCAVYLIVRPSVGRGLRLEDVSRGKKMYF